MAEPQQSPNKPRPISDSPWFWAALFIFTAIVTLAVISPKYTYRYARLERMGATREMIAAGRESTTAGDAEADEAAILHSQEATKEPVRDVTGEAPRRMTLGPLAVVLAMLLAAVAVSAGLVSYFRSAAQRANSEREASERKGAGT